MTLSVLTERRVNSPPGLNGGMPGKRGRNTLARADGRKINLGPKTAVPVYAGVRNTRMLLFFALHPRNVIEIFANNEIAGNRQLSIARACFS